MSAVTCTTAYACAPAYGFVFERHQRSERSCTACARVLSLDRCACLPARGRPRRLGCSRKTRRQRRKVNKCRVADKKRTNQQTNTHYSFIGIDVKLIFAKKRLRLILTACGSYVVALPYLYVKQDCILVMTSVVYPSYPEFYTKMHAHVTHLTGDIYPTWSTCMRDISSWRSSSPLPFDSISPRVDF